MEISIIRSTSYSFRNSESFFSTALPADFPVSGICGSFGGQAFHPSGVYLSDGVQRSIGSRSIRVPARYSGGLGYCEDGVSVANGQGQAIHG